MSQENKSCKHKIYCKSCNIAYKCNLRNSSISGCCNIPFTCSDIFENRCLTKDDLNPKSINKSMVINSENLIISINGIKIKCDTNIENQSVDIRFTSNEEITKIIALLQKNITSKKQEK